MPIQQGNDIMLLSHIEDIPVHLPDYEAQCLCILYCAAGSIRAQVNGNKVTMHAGDLFVSMPRHLIGNCEYDDVFRCRMLLVGSSLFDELIDKSSRPSTQWWNTRMHVLHQPLLSLSERQEQLFGRYYDLLELYLKEADDTRHRIICTIVQAMVNELVMCLDKQLDAELPVSVPTAPLPVTFQKNSLLQRFFQLVQSNAATQRMVQWYAERLNVTSRYLTQVCTCLTGKSAITWITEVAVQEVKKQLLGTGLSIKEIVYRLNFPSLSYFGRYVRKHLGLSPTNYRLAYGTEHPAAK